MLEIATSSLPLVSLFERAVRALANADKVAAEDVLADCSRAEAPASAEEFSRALAQKVILEKMLEQTGRNLRMMRSRNDDFCYGRRRGQNS